MALKLDENACKDAIKATIDAGKKVTHGRGAKRKFVQAESLAAGEYTPAHNGAWPSTEVPPRSRDGIAYEAIEFKSPSGSTVQIGTGSIFNSVKVLDTMPENITKDSKWAGETAQPAHDYYRFGALADMESGEFIDADKNDEVVPFYQPTKFTLKTEIVYVEPRFSSSDNKPIYDSQCRLRKALAVEDYKKFPRQ